MKRLALLLSCFALVASGAEPVFHKVPATELSPRQGLGNFLAKVRANQPVTVAYFGGSITAQGDDRTAKGGWRVKTTAWLRKTYPQAKITEVNAAIGGTDSTLGVFRCGRDVLAHDPDLVFVEFACNDGGDRADPRRSWRAMEGIVRQTWKKNPRTDIVFVYTITVSYVDSYVKGLRPVAASAHDLLAARYGIPSFDFGPRVAALYSANKLVLDPKACMATPVPNGDPNYDRLVREAMKDDPRILFANDGVHPRDEGHDLYLATVQAGFAACADLPAVAHELGAPFVADNLEQAKLVPLERAMMTGSSWRALDAKENLQRAFGNRLGQLWEATKPGDALTFKFKGTCCKIYDLLCPNGGQLWVTVDGRRSARPLPRFDSYCTYSRLADLHVFQGADGVHTVRIELDKDQPSRQSVAFRLKDPAKELATPKYNGTYFYPGQLMLVGDCVRE